MKINVTRSSMPSYEEYCEEIKSIWDNHWLTNCGPKHDLLEKKLAEYLGVNKVTLFTNGHLALETAIAAFDFPKGSEVITTPFTFVSTTNAIVRNGLVPVFCDINEKDYTIDVTKIEALITDKTVAIVPVHVYGNICNVEEIERIAKKHNLKVIYDAAHAFGVKYKGKGICNWGDASMLSFHATKVFNTIEGGAICYNDPSLEVKFKSMKNFGLVGEEECEYCGGNAKMNEFQASMGLCNLKHIDNYIERRKQVYQEYVRKLGGKNGIVLCKPQVDVLTNYAYFPVIFDNYKFSRDEIKERLAANDVAARKYFYPCTNLFKFIKNEAKGFPCLAESISKKILCLPMYHELSFDEIDLICKIILE